MKNWKRDACDIVRSMDAMLNSESTYDPVDVESQGVESVELGNLTERSEIYGARMTTTVAYMAQDWNLDLDLVKNVLENKGTDKPEVNGS